VSSKTTKLNVYLCVTLLQFKGSARKPVQQVLSDRKRRLALKLGKRLAYRYRKHQKPHKERFEPKVP